MKRIILLMLVIILSLPTLAQQQSNNLFEELTEKYADKDGFGASQISSDMFDLYLKKKNIEKDSPVSEALENLDNILVVSFSKFGRSAELVRSGYIRADDPDVKESEKNNALHNQILDYYKSGNYTLLKTEKRMGEDVKVYLKKNSGVVESLALITNSSVSTNLVELQGDIDLKTVSELSQALNLRGLENLYKIDNSSSALYGFSSAGIGALTGERIEEMVARQREMAERQHDLSDEQRAKFEEQAKLMAEKQLLMAEKYREMAEKYQREPIFLNYPGDTNTVYILDGKKVKAKKIKEIEKDKIEKIEVMKGDKKNDKTTIKITTK
jgi:hypothetical protein